MTVTSSVLASGGGWRVADIVCCAGPRDRPFEEQHDDMCVAVVLAGTFQYRSSCGSAVLLPGALLLGNERQCYECGHDHATGDRCVSFHFAPDHLERIAACLPGVRRAGFSQPRLPPSGRLVSLTAAIETACRRQGQGAGLEELSLRLAAAALVETNGAAPAPPAPTRRDQQRITAALRCIEARADEPLTLVDLAVATAMSPYHFLRTFRAVVGMTPHQFILRTRMQRAAVELRQSSESITAIALAAGFGDLSTFNHRFRRVMGQSPRAYRACAT
jgi:AraC-like DNA-binding protein